MVAWRNWWNRTLSRLVQRAGAWHPQRKVWCEEVDSNDLRDGDVVLVPMYVRDVSDDYPPGSHVYAMTWPNPHRNQKQLSYWQMGDQRVWTWTGRRAGPYTVLRTRSEELP